MPAPLRKLVEKPFGPFWDHQVLTPLCKSTPTSVLQLEDVMMACGNRPIGLTFSEFHQPETQNERLASEGRVLLRGVLDIRRLDWLTEDGRRAIQEKLNERDFQWQIAHGGAQPKGDLTLAQLYRAPAGRESGIRVKVLVQGIKQKPAVYMHAKLIPRGLLIQLEDRDRSFAVESMDWETYKLSRLYLARFRLLHEMKEIKEEAGGKDMPIERLTPEWYIEKYLRKRSLPGYFHQHRVIYDSQDADIEPGSDGKLKAGLVRKPRHLSHAEVRSLFAAHAQWLVRDQKKMRFQDTRVIDVKAWEAWLPKVKKWRAMTKELWEDTENVFGKYDPEDDSDVELVPSGSEAEPEEEPEPLAEAIEEHSEPEESPPPGRPKRKRRTITSEEEIEELMLFSGGGSDDSITFVPPDVGLAGPSVVPQQSKQPAGRSVRRLQKYATATARQGRKQTTRADAIEIIYDSDVDSSDSVPDSSDTDDSEPSPPPSPSLLAKVPQDLRAPRPPTGFTWDCSKCKRRIDMLRLTDEDTRCLSPYARENLVSGHWNLHHPGVQDAFWLMIMDHHNSHLRAFGVEIASSDDGSKRWLQSVQ